MVAQAFVAHMPPHRGSGSHPLTAEEELAPRLPPSSPWPMPSSAADRNSASRRPAVPVGTLVGLITCTETSSGSSSPSSLLLAPPWRDRRAAICFSRDKYIPGKGPLCPVFVPVSPASSSPVRAQGRPVLRPPPATVEWPTPPPPSAPLCIVDCERATIIPPCTVLDAAPKNNSRKGRLR